MTNGLEAHYGRHVGLVPGILAGLSAAGYDIDALDPTALSGADEFHLGGRDATLAVLESVRGGAPEAVLDVGCGIGGPARTIAHELGATTLGIDLTPSFVEASRCRCRGRLLRITSTSPKPTTISARSGRPA